MQAKTGISKKWGHFVPTRATRPRNLAATRHQWTARIAEMLNNRPRKCLNYRTPAEMFGVVLRFNP